MALAFGFGLFTHPFGLLVAFAATAAAFLAFGMVIAMLVDIPAVQALGSDLPAHADDRRRRGAAGKPARLGAAPLSLFPGRYAVEAIAFRRQQAAAASTFWRCF